MDKLHIVVVISNVCEYKRRWELFDQFIKRLSNKTQCQLYVVELAYGDQEYQCTDKDNIYNLQLRTDYALWHKENMINIGIQRLLPNDWKYVAWIDADIEFDNSEWIEQCIELLSNKYEVVQLFDYVHLLDQYNQISDTKIGFGHSFTIKNKGGHPGYAWACTRHFYERIGGLLDICILGGADSIMSRAFSGCSIIHHVCPKYQEAIKIYVDNVTSKKICLGNVPGTIKHYYHGSIKNRQYDERPHILYRNYYQPDVYLIRNDDGLLIPSQECPDILLEQILDYFFSRNEDDV